jgi:hypothetical protein
MDERQAVDGADLGQVEGPQRRSPRDEALDVVVLIVEVPRAVLRPTLKVQ